MFDRIAANLFQLLTVGSKSPSLQAFEEAFRKKVSQFVEDGTYSQDEIEAELRQAVHQFFDVPRIVHLEEQEDTEEDLVLLNARLNAYDFELNGWLDREKLNELRQTVFVDRHLKRTFSLKGEVQNWVLWNAAQILSRCNSPFAWDANKNGLVYGMVQSGKTASMQALTLLAFASGYDVVIILTSVSVALRQQTQNRFDELFSMDRPSGEAPSMSVSSPTRESDSPGKNVSSDEYFDSAKVVHGKRGSSLPTCQYLVVKKETRILPKLVSQVQGFVKKMNENGVEPKFLILDDEADYGSLDTGRKKQSTTNERIEALRQATRYSDYIAYTATPQGCLAADVDAEIGFPRDFIWVLEPSVPIVDGTPQVGSYTGGQELLVDYQDVTTRRIPDSDWPFHSKSNETGYHGVVSTRTRSVANMGLTEAEDEFLEDVITGRRPVPESLVNCLLDYVISGAVRWAEVCRNAGIVDGVWDVSIESELPRHALMIHQSRLRDNQREGQMLVKIAWNEAKTAIQDGDNSYRKRVLDFVTMGRRFDESISIDASYEYAVKGIIEVTDRKIKAFDKSGQITTTPAFIYLLNSDTEHILEYRDGHDLEVKRAAIVLGGDKLSRGLTIEGLAVSYYVRSQKESLADTVMQMARWFGHKAKFIHLMRVYLQDVNRELFQELIHEDLRLRYELKKDIRDGVPPTESLFHLRTSKLFSASNRNKTKRLEEALIGEYVNGVADVKWFLPDVRVIEHNHKVLLDAVEGWSRYVQPDWVHGNRARLFRHISLDVVSGILNQLNCSHSILPGSEAIAAFLNYWMHHTREFGAGLNVAIMGGEDGGYAQRKRAGVPKGEVDEANLKGVVLNEFKSILGGTRTLSDGKYQGDRFIDMPPSDHKGCSIEMLRKRRKDVLLLIYQLDPHYINRTAHFKPGDPRYLDTNSAIVAMSLVVPESSTSNMRAWVNQGLKASK